MNPAPHKVLLRPLVALLLCAAIGSAGAADSRASKYYEDALQRYEKKDIAGAIVQLKNALQIDGKMLPVHVLLGKALLANGEVNAAEAALDEALRLGVNPTEVVLPLAEAVIAQGKPGQLLNQTRFAHASLPADLKLKLLLLKAAAASDVGSSRDAIKLLEEARTIDAKNAATWAAEVPIRVRARQMNEAKAAAEKAVGLDPKSAQAAYEYASVAHIAGDLKTAIARYTKTLEIKPDHVNALVARAGLYIDLKRFDEADVDVKAARKVDPKDPRSAYLNALLVERKGDTVATRKALNEVANLFDPIPLEYLRYRPQVLILGGLAHFGLEQFEKAKPYLEVLQRQDAGHPVAKLLAQIYLRDKRTDKAIEVLEPYLKSNPADVQALKLLASSQMVVGRYARSAQLMQEALKQGDDPSMRTMLGVSLVGTGKYADGAAELEATLKKDPKQLPAGVSLAGLLITSGQGAKAVMVVEQLLKQQPQNPGLLNLLGTAHATKGDVAAARSAFEQALKLDPKYTEPQINLARLEIDQKALDPALKRLNAVVALDDKNLDALLEIARLYSANGNAEESLKWLNRAEDVSGANLRPGLQLVSFHLARGRPDLARQAVAKLQGKQPEALSVLLALARVQLANKEPNEARATLTRAATQVSYDAAALVQVAELQVAAGNIPGAAHALDKALAAKPEHLRARVMRSSVALMQGDSANAEKLAKGLLASDPKSPMGYVLLGDVARARNQPAAALEAYKKAYAIEPTTQSVLAVFHATAVSQHGAAIALAEQWLKTHPGDTGVLRAVADSQAQAGNLAPARAAYENLLKINPLDADALNNLAVVLVGLKDPSALATAERALKLKPEVPHIIGTTGWAAFHANQPDRALQLLRDARLRDPNNASTHFYLGTVLAKQGRNTEAREELEASLRGGPRFAYAKEAEQLLKSLR